MPTKHRPPRGNVLVNVVIALVLLLIMAIIGGYAVGWIKFTSQSDKATIEIETGQIQDATNNAANQASEELNQLQKRAGEVLNDAGNAIPAGEADDDITPVDPPSTPIPVGEPAPNDVSPTGPPVAPASP